MQIKYLCPYWGKESTDAQIFIKEVLGSGYDGVEIHLPDDLRFINSLVKLLSENGLLFVAQHYVETQYESFATYRKQYIKKLEQLASLNPLFINSHTGRDFWPFENNSQLIEDAFLIEQKTGIPIYHETHRGRFSFHLANLMLYLDRFPKLKLTADFSHWCTVSESFLEDQKPLLEHAIQHSVYIHARVGHTQSPQVNDPFAPEWNSTLNTFVNWWKKILEVNRQKGVDLFAICPEFGPYPYMPRLPFTEQPINNQWILNVKMKDYLKQKIGCDFKPIVH